MRLRESISPPTPDSAREKIKVPLQVVSADPKEPNNQAGSATPVALGAVTPVGLDAQTHQTMDKLTRHDAAGEIALNIKDYERAQSLYSESLALFEELNIKPGMAASLRGLGVALSRMNQEKDAMIKFERAMGLDAMAGNDEGIAADHMALGDNFAQTGRYEDALLQYREAFGRQKKADDAAAMLRNGLKQAEMNLLFNRQEAPAAALFQARSLAAQNDPAAADKIDHEFSRMKSLMGEEALGELQGRIEIYNNDKQEQPKM